MASNAQILQELEASGNIRFADYPPQDPPIAKEKLVHWKRIFGEVSPREVIAAMKDGFVDVTIHLSGKNRTAAYFYFRDRLSDTQVNFSSTVIDADGSLADAGKVHLSDTRVEGEQSKGTAKKMRRNFVDMLEHHYPNVERLTIMADQVGSYAWLKFGYIPKYLSDDICDMIRTRMGWIKNQLPANNRRQIETILRTRNPKGLLTIADMTEPVTVPSHPTEEHLLDTTPILHPGDKTTLGKFLLIDTVWSGALNLKDPKSMERFRNYVSERKQIPPRLNHPARISAKNPVTQR